MWFYMILMNFWWFFKIWWILWLFVHFLRWLICFARGVFMELCCFIGFFKILVVCVNATGYWKFIFFLILMCIIGVSVFVDFFIKICIILVFFWCLSYFLLLLVLLAQVVWFIVVFCFVVMFVFYGGVIKCLIFLLAIGTVSIKDFYFCNFFVIFTIFFTIFLSFIIKKHQIFLVQIYFTVYFILMCCIPSSSKGSEVVTNPNFS